MALAFDPGAPNERAMRERDVRRLSVVGESACGVRADGERDESPHAGQDDAGVEASAVRSDGGLSGESPVTEAEFSDAVAEYVNACQRVQDAMRAQVATWEAELVMHECWLNMRALAYALGRDAA